MALHKGPTHCALAKLVSVHWVGSLRALIWDYNGKTCDLCTLIAHAAAACEKPVSRREGWRAPRSDHNHVAARSTTQKLSCAGCFTPAKQDKRTRCPTEAKHVGESIRFIRLRQGKRPGPPTEMQTVERSGRPGLPAMGPRYCAEASEQDGTFCQTSPSRWHVNPACRGGRPPSCRPRRGRRCPWASAGRPSRRGSRS